MMAERDSLPREFTQRMEKQLKGEAVAFFESYSKESVSGIRCNTAKIAREEIPFSLTNVPWAQDGYYVSQDAPVSRHPFYFAGCYYIQEPSAMFPAAALKAKPEDIVLDLCAAPGGKATQLASSLNGRGLLIANDVSASRARALLKNMTMWGTPDSCISAETPERLENLCGCCFDKILVDAPCSGEGMFRRDPSMIASWQQRGPFSYASCQKEILLCALKMLKPGGILAYSTCTFSEEENEDVVSFALEKYPGIHLIYPKACDGFAPGIGARPLDACVRLYPHRLKGEGHFLALMEKSSDLEPGLEGIYPLKEDEVDKSREKMPEEVSSFMARLPASFLSSYGYRQIKDQCLLVPPYHLPSLRYLRTGVLIGTVKSGRFDPSQDLSMLLSSGDFDAVLDLKEEDPRVIRYLRGETIPLTDEEQRAFHLSKDGWILVCYSSRALGWGKISGVNLKNKRLPGWRYR